MLCESAYLTVSTPFTAEIKGNIIHRKTGNPLMQEDKFDSGNKNR